MDSARWEQIQAVFLEASALSEPQRTAFLQKSCGGDAKLLAEVRAMLEADSRATSILDHGLPHIADRLIGPAHSAIRVQEVGAYRLIRFIGEGGMGAVYLAERRDAGNQVAIKFLLHAGLSPARRERFAREIKLLGKLKHPAIARLYDAGTLEDGTPWFVMEYVEGRRLVEYCPQAARTGDELIHLFRRVCEAVQYAHGQEIIHRDLKPSNIVVDEQGTPRLLDFGIAKELHSLEGEAEYTRSGLRLMTPEYAAPEWADEGIVGPYTDVYSLGVILYQMLSGQLPPKSAEEEARKPSSSGAKISGLSKSSWGDLDRLCLTAMQKDVSARYQSVEALLRDIDHYLKHEPLEAQPESLRYRVSKFVIRNRRAVLVASLVLAAFAGTAILFTVRLAKERDTALAEAARTRRIERFTLSLFGAGDRAAAPSKDLRVVTLLDVGAQEANELRADPETQAEIYQTLGQIYHMLGNLRRAGELESLGLEKMKAALGPRSPKVAEGLSQLALLRADQGQFKEAERLAREGLTLASSQLPASDPVVLRAKSALGQVLATSRSYDNAIKILDPIVRLEPSGEEGSYIMLQNLTALAVAEQYAGHYERSEVLHRRALELDRSIYGRSHPRVAIDLADLGAVEVTLGRYPEAEKLYRESLGIGNAWYGEAQPDVLAAKSILATILIQEGKLAEADSLLKSVLPLLEQVFGEKHPYVCFTLDSLGKLAYRRGDLHAAQNYFERALAISDVLYGDADFNTAIVKSDLSDIFIEEGQYTRAEPLLREAATSAIQHPLPGNPSVGVIDAKLGRVLVRLRRYQEAESPLAAGYAILLTANSKVYAKRLADARSDLVTVYTALNEPEKAGKFR
ncbi:MAG TPA: serine/threonine-protein kinase [Bryobacteraceae bacterium]|nr:serine/threonine-protein kinase [Bryobacteraceae bacterium]